jgi:two-component system CheB/CheR fusion protein
MVKQQSRKTGRVTSETVYYVGVGASAGGLEALQDFFKAMPVDSGMVFIVIQHLSPDYKSLMDELLARQTDIPIRIAADGMMTEVNTIYLIPPKHNLSIFHGKLFLEEQKERKGLNLPIDIFFRSLAADKGKNSVGVILSGTGSDGALGIRTIKEAGGMVLVQDEKSAKFDGMPRSAVATGLVDYILPPAKMAEELMNYIEHPLIKKTTSLEKIMSKNVNTLSKIILILRDHCGIDFSYYKENTIIRRLERRVSINRFSTLEEYIEFFSESDKEKDTLYRELLIGVTRFFRDQEAYASIRKNVLPAILKPGRAVRIWSTGCSTGEEVYSLAMEFLEYIEEHNLDCEVKFFATDIDRHSLDTAGRGFYSDGIASDVEPQLLSKYFSRRENGYQISDKVRKMVVFAAHNLTKDPPFSKLDLLVCRNLFIYLKPDMQQRLLSMFYYSTAPAGFLFMGSSESIGEMSEAFAAVDAKWKIYKPRPDYRPALSKNTIIPRMQLMENDGSVSAIPLLGGVKLERLLEGAAASALPPSVIVDESDNIVHVINDINPYFSVRSGKFSTNIVANLPNELGLFVSNILRRLKLEKKPIAFENIAGVKNFEGNLISVSGRVIIVESREFYLLSFTTGICDSVSMPGKEIINAEVGEEVKNRVNDLERDLQITKESLQATVEELETSNEELQSSNEELIASNEELQSTNEELQSVNEELFTVNSEYQVKIDELTRLNADLDNLLRNIDVGALYLDRGLCIRKLTPLVSKITNIMPSDIGRPIAHLTVMPTYLQLYDDVNHVVETLQTFEREIRDSQDNVWKVGIRPYRTEYNAVEGVLITFIDITMLKREQEMSNESRRRLEAALEVGRMAWWEWDLLSGTVAYDDKKATMLGYTVEEFPNEIYKICDLIHPEDYQKTMQAMRDYLEGKSEQWETTYRIKRKDGGYSWYYDRGIISRWQQDGTPELLIGTVQEISGQKTLEHQLARCHNLLESMLENEPIAKTMVNAEGAIIYANAAARDLFAISKSQIYNRSYDASGWQISAKDGSAIPPEELPFSLIKNMRLPVAGYEHYIQVPGHGKVLLRIDGIPVLRQDGEFEGCIFSINFEEGGE